MNKSPIHQQRIKLVLSFFAVTFGLLYATSITKAQQVSLTAIPPRIGEDFKLKAKPGEKVQTTIRIKNTSGQPIAIESALEDFIIDEDGSTPIPISDEVSTRWSLSSWSIVSPKNQIIAPGGDANINLLIEVPEDALPGGHYGMVLSQPANQGAAAGSQSSIGQRVGTLVYFLVEGPINEEAFISNLSFPQFTEYGPVPFSFQVENVSDIHITPQISVNIYNIFGKKVETLQMEAKNVFPFVPRQFSGEWDRTWGIGPYTAEVIMSYGSQGQITIAKTGFWLLPITIVISIIVGLLILIVLLSVIRKQLVEKQQYNKKKIEMLEKKLSEMEK